MNEKTQVVLAAALAHVRDMRSAQSGDIPVRIAHASGVIAGLEDTGALTSAEAGQWKRRLDELTAETGAFADQPSEPRTDKYRLGAPAGFLRLIPGPFEAPLFDSRLRVLVVELFEDRLYVYWHMTALPGAESTLGKDAAALNRDLEGLAKDTQDMEKQNAVRTRLLTREFALSDDVGTKFRAIRGSAGGVQDDQWGARVFVPAVPVGASTLRLEFHDAHLSIPLK
jgi:hypothetical protein